MKENERVQRSHVALADMFIEQQVLCPRLARRTGCALELGRLPLCEHGRSSAACVVSVALTWCKGLNVWHFVAPLADDVEDKAEAAHVETVHSQLLFA